MIIFAVFIVLFCLGTLLVSLYKLAFKGDILYLIIFFCLFLPFYQSLLTITYHFTGAIFVVNAFKYSKEIVVLTAIASLFFFKRDPFSFELRLTTVDWIFIAFLSLGFVFVILPVGGASFTERLIYYKNIFMLGAAYFIGRNSSISNVDVRLIFKLIVSVTFLAFFFSYYEYLSNTHFQSVIGLERFNREVNQLEPSGSFGLTWTFETAAGNKRFAAFFSNPLDMAASMLLGLGAGIVLVTSSPFRINRLIYSTVFLAAIGCVFFSFSRSSFLGVFLMLLFVSILFRYYTLLILGLFLVASSIVYIVFFAPRDIQDFILDTLTFQNPSSFGHLLAWFEGLLSMIEKPWGAGLAMSGSSAIVDDELKIGGENQFLIFGVQLGVLGLILYLALIATSVSYSMKAYRIAANREAQVIPFLAASVKFSLLFPLMTSNTENYLFISWVSWWMVGYSVQLYNKSRSA